MYLLGMNLAVDFKHRSILKKKKLIHQKVSTSVTLRKQI